MTSKIDIDSDVIALREFEAGHSFVVDYHSEKEFAGDEAIKGTTGSKPSPSKHRKQNNGFADDMPAVATLRRISLPASAVLLGTIWLLHWLINKTLFPTADVVASALVLLLTGFIAVSQQIIARNAPAYWLLDNARSVGLSLAALAGVAFFPMSLTIIGGLTPEWLIHMIASLIAIMLSAFASWRLSAADSLSNKQCPAITLAIFTYILTAIAFAVYAALVFALLNEAQDPMSGFLAPYKLLQIPCLVGAGLFFVFSGLPKKLTELLSFENRPAYRSARPTGEAFEHMRVSEYGMKLLMQGHRPAMPIGIWLRGNIGRFSESGTKGETFYQSQYDNELRIDRPVTFRELQFISSHPGVTFEIIQGGRPIADNNRLLVSIELTKKPPAGFDLTLSLRRSGRRDAIILDILFEWRTGNQWAGWVELEKTSSDTLLGAIKVWFLRFMLRPGRKLLEQEHQQALASEKRIRTKRD